MIPVLAFAALAAVTPLTEDTTAPSLIHEPAPAPVVIEDTTAPVRFAAVEAPTVDLEPLRISIAARTWVARVR